MQYYGVLRGVDGVETFMQGFVDVTNYGEGRETFLSEGGGARDERWLGAWFGFFDNAKELVGRLLDPDVLWLRHGC